VNEQNIQNHILVCKNLQKAYNHLKSVLDGENCKYFTKDDFLLEDAKNVVKEAYIAEKNIKILVLGAKSFNIYAQNSLLKILEEPPRNIVFILVCETKNIFLPTIRSRLSTKELDVKEEKIQLNLDIENLDLQKIYNFIQDNSRISKNELKTLIQDIVSVAICQNHINFNTKEMEHFEKLLQLSELNTRPNNILISLLLTIYLKKNK
jgi:DNA polymerase-3 subunit delta'